MIATDDCEWWKLQRATVAENYHLDDEQTAQALVAFDALRQNVLCGRVNINDYDRVILESADGAVLHTMPRRMSAGATTLRASPPLAYRLRFKTKAFIFKYRKSIAILAAVCAAALIECTFSKN